MRCPGGAGGCGVLGLVSRAGSGRRRLLRGRHAWCGVVRTESGSMGVLAERCYELSVERFCTNWHDH